MANTTAKVDVGGGAHDYAVLNGSVGPQVIDIRKLYADTGMFTYDPGFTSTASCESGLTYIDGDEGVLLHRGYPIDQLAEQSSFMEVAYLLLNGELPDKATLDNFVTTISRHTMVHEQLTDLLSRFPPRRAPDGDHVRRGRRAFGLLSRLDRYQRSDPARIASHRLIAKMPTHRRDGL
jgi:citrate synthase